MNVKSILAAAVLVVAFQSCKDTKAEEEKLNQQLDQIEAVEEAVDSTLQEVHSKTKEVEELIQELDSI